MNRSAIIILFSLFCIFCSACSITPVRHDDNQTPSMKSDNYDVLGRVSIKGEGYLGLLDSAQRLYPGTDDVIGVIIDKKTFSIFWTFWSEYQLSGWAIRYKRTANNSTL